MEVAIQHKTDTRPGPIAVKADRRRGSPAHAPTSHLHLLADAVWLGFVLFSLGLFLATIPARYLNLRDEALLIGSAVEQLQLDLSLMPGYVMTFDALTLSVYLLVGILIFWRKRMGWASYFASLTLIIAVTGHVRPTGSLFFADPRLRIPLLVLFALEMASVYVLLFTFPDGHFVPRWTIWPVLVSVAYVFSAYLGPVVAEGPLRWPPTPVSPAVYIPIGIAAVFQIYRYRHRSTQQEREQTKWIVYGLTIATIGLLCFHWIVPAVWPQVLEPGPDRLAYIVVGLPLVDAALMLFPLTISISILFHRLWDINLLINRTLLYGSLTAILAGVYIASITLFQRLFLTLTAQRSGLAEIVTTFIVVAAFSPVKDQLQKVIDKRWKETSAEARFKSLATQIEARISPVEWEQVTDRLLNEAVMGFCAKGGAVYREESSGLRLVRRQGKWDGEPKVTVDLTAGVARPRLGIVALGARLDGTDYTERERHALTLIAATVARAIEHDQRQAEHHVN